MGTQYDAGATTALALDSTVRGAAFTGSARRVLVLWARTQGATETASATQRVSTTGSGFDAYAWNAAQTGMHTMVAAAAGSATLALTGDPLIFVERP